jgi:hypothetical protein
MLSDPIRLAALAAAPSAGAPPAPPADGGPPLGPEEAAPIPGQATFDEFLRAMNPLHHLPGVGILYRAATGERIQPAFRVLGGLLYGGVSGFFSTALLSAVEEFRPAERLALALRGEPDPLLGPADAARAAAAYAQDGGDRGAA